MNWQQIKFTNALALTIILMCFGYFFYISSSHFPTALLKDIGDIKIAMITIVTGIIGYYYGSSKHKENEYIAPTKKKPKMEEITGYFIDLPEGANSIAVNGGEDTPLSTYAGGAYTPETSTHFGLVVWDASTAITSVVVNTDTPVEVQTLIAGHHPVAKPK